MIDNKTIRQVVINKALLPCTPGELEYHEIATAAGGYSVAFTTNTETALQDLVVSVVPTQSGEGDPTPENIREISGVDKLRFLYASFPSATVNHSFEVELGQTVYGGEVDVVGGEVTTTYKLADLSAMDWDSGAPNQDGYIRFVNRSAWSDKANGYKLLCDKFPVKTSLIPSSPTTIGISGYSSNANIYIAVESSMLTGDLSTNAGRNTAFRGWISDNGLQILYELATPTTAQITPVTVNSIKGRQKMQSREKFGFSLKYPIMVGGSCEISKQFMPIFYPNGKGVKHHGSTF